MTPTATATTTASKAEARETELCDQLQKIIRQIADFEYELAKQIPLSDSVKTLSNQYDYFNEFIKRITKCLPSFHCTLDKARVFASMNQAEDASKLKEEIGSYYNEAKNRLDCVRAKVYLKSLIWN